MPAWNNTIIEAVLKKLKENNKNYKYVGKLLKTTSTVRLTLATKDHRSKLLVFFYKELVPVFTLEVPLFGIKIMMASRKITAVNLSNGINFNSQIVQLIDMRQNPCTLSSMLMV